MLFINSVYWLFMQVEHIETRMKEDIFSEVTQSGGQMLLHREEYNPASDQSSVIGYWENIWLNDVKTPAEVYAALKDEGYDIEYRRIPLTREREAFAADVDAIQSCRDEYASNVNCSCRVELSTALKLYYNTTFCCADLLGSISLYHTLDLGELLMQWQSLVLDLAQMRNSCQSKQQKHIMFQLQ